MNSGRRSAIYSDADRLSDKSILVISTLVEERFNESVLLSGSDSGSFRTTRNIAFSTSDDPFGVDELPKPDDPYEQLFRVMRLLPLPYAPLNRGSGG